MLLSISVRDALRWGIEKLKKARVETPVLDAEVLLIHSTFRPNRRMNQLMLYAYPERVLRGATFIRYKRLIARRVRREPVAYILGHKEFYGLDFLVNRHVLVPRPESETLVEQAFRQCKMENVECKIIDIGTGSGAIAVAVAVECRMKNVECRIIGTDISAAALRMARKNARRHGVEKKIRFLHGNLLEPLKNVILNAVKDPVQTAKDGILRFAQNDRWVAVANLPYLSTVEWRAAMPEVRKYEPRGALDGGKDGLKYYRELFKQVSGFRGQASGVVLCEICPEQARAFQKMVRGYFPRAKFKVVKDLAGRNRVAVVKI